MNGPPSPDQISPQSSLASPSSFQLRRQSDQISISNKDLTLSDYTALNPPDLLPNISTLPPSFPLRASPSALRPPRHVDRHPNIAQFMENWLQRVWPPDAIHGKGFLLEHPRGIDILTEVYRATPRLVFSWERIDGETNTMRTWKKTFL